MLKDIKNFVTKTTPCTQNPTFIELKTQLEKTAENNNTNTPTSSDSESEELINLIKNPDSRSARDPDIRSARTSESFTSRVRSQSIPTTSSYRSLSATLLTETPTKPPQFAPKAARF